MKHVDLCHVSHHDPPRVTKLATIFVSFGRSHRHGQILRHLMRICHNQGLWVEHVSRAPKVLVLYVANATMTQLRELDRRCRSDIVVAIEL